MRREALGRKTGAWSAGMAAMVAALMKAVRKINEGLLELQRVGHLQNKTHRDKKVGNL